MIFHPYEAIVICHLLLQLSLASSAMIRIYIPYRQHSLSGCSYFKGCLLLHCMLLHTERVTQQLPSFGLLLQL